MADVPWFMLSPSPFSLIQYAILTWIVSRYLLKNVEYKRFPQLFSLIDGFMIMAFFVVLCDSFWCGFTTLKWLPLHPGDLFQISSSFFRDVVACLLFSLFIVDYFRSGALTFNLKSLGYLLLCFGSQAIWFDLAPSPAFTDYTYAWRHGFPLEIVSGSFLLSHFLMRIPLWLLIKSVLFSRTNIHRAYKRKQPITEVNNSGV